MISIKKTLALAAISLFSLGASASNVIVNGLSDFGSSYTIGGDPYAPGTINIGSDPRALHSSWFHFDTPVGNMLIVNGGVKSAENVVWSSQKITLDAGTSYDFGAAVASLYDENRATLRAVLSVNDIDYVLGEKKLGAAGEWLSWSGARVSGVSGDAQLKLLNLTDAYSGNDFAITGLSLNSTVTAVPEPQSYALMLAGLAAMGFVARRRQSR